MKKLLLLIILFLLITIRVNALDVNFKIEGFYVNATVQENGDMLVKEVIVQNGSFNGYEREIYINSDNKLYDASDIELIRVCKASGTDFNAINNVSTCFTKVYKGNLGDSLVYEKVDYENGFKLKMYNYTNKGYTSYYIEYLLKNVVIVHNDIAELRWNFVPSVFKDNINNTRIIVNLYDESNVLRVWSHGPLYGENKIIDKKSIEYFDDGLEKGTSVDIRIVFDKNLITNASKTTNENKFDSIIEEETKLAKKANEKRKRAQTIETIRFVVIISSSVFWLIGLIIIWIYMYKKYDKEYKSEFNEKYFRDFPGDYSPETVQYLMEKRINTIGLSSSILNIIRKKGLKVEETKEKKGVIFKREEKDYLLIKDIEKEPLTSDETNLRQWLLWYFGDENQFKLSSMKEKTKSLEEAKEFIKWYNGWVTDCKKEAKKENFYEDVSSKKVLPALYGSIPMILFIFTAFIVPLFGVESLVFNIILSIPGIAFLIYLFSFTKKTKKGNEHYKKWKALKNFLIDFGSFKDKELPEIHLWEKYLVYANVFGIAEKLRKDMEVRIQNIPDANVSLNTFNYLYINSAINNSISNSVSSAISSATSRIASSSVSSGGGFGGGSSGGGGGGGGSGGGGGF